jgi:hypothetical protein
VWGGGYWLIKPLSAVKKNWFAAYKTIYASMCQLEKVFWMWYQDMPAASAQVWISSKCLLNWFVPYENLLGGKGLHTENTREDAVGREGVQHT